MAGNSNLCFQAKTRSAGCAAYMAPERIDPPNPSKPDYDIRADVWSLGITLVELATGHFPYRDCKTDFEVLTKVLQVRLLLFYLCRSQQVYMTKSQNCCPKII